MLLKPSSGECCAPRYFVLFVTFQGTRVRLTYSPHLVPRHTLNEMGYGNIGYRQMKQCNKIL